MKSRWFAAVTLAAIAAMTCWHRAGLADEPAKTANGAVRKGMAEVAEPVLYFETAGKGSPVVLIHGGQMDCRMWDDQFRDYAKDFQVIRYDVRGFGKSIFPNYPFSSVKDLCCLLDFLRVKKAQLVGLSLGGRIAIDFALAHPERVQSLVLVGSGLSGFAWSAASNKAYLDILQASQEGREEAANEFWLKDPYMAPAMENPAVAKRIRAICLENVRNNLLNPVMERDQRLSAIDRLGSITAPTLIVVGSRDVPDIQKIVEKLKHDIPHARKVVIEGSGHIVNMEKCQEFDGVVLPFLKEHSAGGPG
jgi:pimeloyl-ACP methyl ester carboxylesterase